MSEKEADRLRRAVALLADAQRDAQDAARRGLSGEDSYDTADPEKARERLEEALVDVLDILDGASEDVNEILREAGEEGDGRRR